VKNLTSLDPFFGARTEDGFDGVSVVAFFRESLYLRNARSHVLVHLVSVTFRVDRVVLDHGLQLLDLGFISSKKVSIHH